MEKQSRAEQSRDRIDFVTIPISDTLLRCSPAFPVPLRAGAVNHISTSKTYFWLWLRCARATLFSISIPVSDTLLWMLSRLASALRKLEKRRDADSGFLKAVSAKKVSICEDLIVSCLLVRVKGACLHCRRR